MVALYFTVQPLAYEEILRLMEVWEKEEERQREEELAELRHYVQSLTRKELQVQLLDALLEIEVLRQDPWSRYPLFPTCQPVRSKDGISCQK